MKTFFRKRPWIWIFVAFFVLFGAWATLFTIAYQNQPEVIPLEEISSSAESQPETETPEPKNR